MFLNNLSLLCDVATNTETNSLVSGCYACQKLERIFLSRGDTVLDDIPHAKLPMVNFEIGSVEKRAIYSVHVSSRFMIRIEVEQMVQQE